MLKSWDVFEFLYFPFKKLFYINYVKIVLTK